MHTVTDNIAILIIAGIAGGLLLAVALILVQLRSQNRWLLQRKEFQQAELAHQKELMHAILTSQETERRRIGMDLHDEIGTRLSLLRLMICEFTTNGVSGVSAAEFSKQSRSVIDTVINSLSHISHDLSPRISRMQDFFDSIHDVAYRINGSGNIQMEISEPDTQWDHSAADEAAMSLYRVVTELVNNTLRHAEATHIWLSLIADSREIIVRYRDNGIGLCRNSPKKAPGMGLKNIESRLALIGATYRIESSPGGFALCICIPLQIPVV